MDSIYNYCKLKNADSLVNFDAKEVSKTQMIKGSPFIMKGIEISGFAIKGVK